MQRYRSAVAELFTTQGVIFRENSRNIVNDTRYFPWKFFTNDESGYFPWNTEITIAGPKRNPEP